MKAITIRNDKALQATAKYPMDENPAAVYLAQLTSKQSRRTMAWALEAVTWLVRGIIKEPIEGERIKATKLYLDFPWASMRYQHVQAIRAQFIDIYEKPATVNIIIAAIRGTLKQAWLLGHLPGEDYRKISEIKFIANETLLSGKALSQGEVNSISGACQVDPSIAGIRDGAIIGLMFSGGLRRAEIVKLDLEDYNVKTGALRIKGKGNKEREIFLVNGPTNALADWLELRSKNPGALFWSINKGGNFKRGRMTSQAIYNICIKRGAEAQANFTPHDARRTYVTDLLEKGNDSILVSKLVGHSSPETTARYDRRGDAAKIEAAATLHYPWTRRTLTLALDKKGNAREE